MSERTSMRAIEDEMSDDFEVALYDVICLISSEAFLHAGGHWSPTPPKCARAPNKNMSDSLLDWVINRRKPSEREVRPLAQQLARSLSLLHAHGVVHRSTVSYLLPHDTHINA